MASGGSEETSDTKKNSMHLGETQRLRRDNDQKRPGHANPDTECSDLDTLSDIFYRHIALTSDHPLGLTVSKAEGPLIILEDGTEITDLISGIAVSAVGHRHPKVVEAIRQQIDRHLHVMVYGEFVQESQVLLAELLADQLPGPLDTVYFCNSGAEAVEGALKVAKKATGRSGMVAFEGSYHGDTHGALSVTGRQVYRKPFLPLLPEVRFLPFDDPNALDRIGSDDACVIVEPIQGEGGIRVPGDAWMRALHKRCRDVGALLIFDEIQTGLGRTGTLFAYEQVGLVPDIMCLAKALGGGMPLGAFVSSGRILSVIRNEPPLSHVTTFGGHPVSCAAGHAALQVILDERLSDRANEIGARMRKMLVHDHIVEIRGRGAMLGMELRDAALTAAVVSQCLAKGVLLGWTLHSDTLVRLAPPLNIPMVVLEEACSTILQVLDEQTR